MSTLLPDEATVQFWREAVERDCTFDAFTVSLLIGEIDRLREQLEARTKCANCSKPIDDGAHEVRCPSPYPAESAS